MVALTRWRRGSLMKPLAREREEGEKEVSNSAEVSLFEVAWFIKI